MSSVKVSTDTQKNRLYIRLSGFFSESQAKRVVLKAMHAVRELNGHFDVINDIRGSKPLSDDAAEQILRMHQNWKEYGLRRAVRVVGEDIMVNDQFQTLSSNAGFRARITKSRKEAESLLDQSP